MIFIRPWTEHLIFEIIMFPMFDWAPVMFGLNLLIILTFASIFAKLFSCLDTAGKNWLSSRSGLGFMPWNNSKILTRATNGYQINTCLPVVCTYCTDNFRKIHRSLDFNIWVSKIRPFCYYLFSDEKDPKKIIWLALWWGEHRLHWA